MKISVKNMILVALFAAITAVCAQIAIPVPFSTVPFTLQVVAVCLAGGVLGKKLGTLSIIVYLLLGAIGIPVFAKFTGSLSILVGPTGGFLLSFPIATYIIGSFLERKRNYFTAIVSMLLGLIVIYGMGMVQFKYVTAMSWEQTFAFTFVPFILPDLIKIALTARLVLDITRTLAKNNLLVNP